jgi:hypothetical protein
MTNSNLHQKIQKIQKIPKNSKKPKFAKKNNICKKTNFGILAKDPATCNGRLSGLHGQFSPSQ